MSHPFTNNGQEPHFFQRPPRALQYEEAENHPDPDPEHTPQVKSFPRFQQPEQFLSTVPIAGPSSQWYSLPGASSAPSSSGSFPTSGIRSFPQSASQTSYAFPLGIHGVPMTSPAEPVYQTFPNAPSGSSRSDPAFLANGDPSSEPVRQRPRTNGKPELNNASIDAPSNAKLYRISDNDYQNSPNVPYPANTYNNNFANPNSFNNFVGPSASSSYANTTPYPNYRNVDDAFLYSVPCPPVPPNPAYNMGPNQIGPNAMAVNNTPWYNQNEKSYRPASNQLSALPAGVGPPAAHLSRTQFGPNVYPGYGGMGSYAFDSGLSAIGNGNYWIPDFAPPNLPNAPLGWTSDLPAPESSYNYSMFLFHNSSFR